jgi:hypothetical protein
MVPVTTNQQVNYIGIPSVKVRKHPETSSLASIASFALVKL